MENSPHRQGKLSSKYSNEFIGFFFMIVVFIKILQNKAYRVPAFRNKNDTYIYNMNLK